VPEVLCITGTDTDAGKTLVTGALARAAMQAGRQVLVLKPVQTGCGHGDSHHHDGMGMRVAPPPPTDTVPDVATYRTAAPAAIACAIVQLAPACSPHLAARQAGVDITVHDLAEQVRDHIARHKADLVLIEGAGGLLTPLNSNEVLADLFAELRFPLLLVVANRLGAVNHALLTIETCSARSARGCIPLAGFVTTETSPAAGPAEHAIRKDNASIIATLGRLPCLAAVPHISGLHGSENAREAAWNTAAAAVSPVLETMRRPPCHCTRAAAPDIAPERLLAYDREHLWHPYTSAQTPARTWEAVYTRGTRITLRDGRELVDGMSSWWCAIHGYNHPALLDALQEQSKRMPHVMFGGLTHKPAVELAQSLLGMVPQGLAHVFYADSGSVAVEVALKMALQYQMAAGRPQRNRILSLRGGYHGDTMGAMSVCDPENGMHHLFSGMLPRQIFAPRPECPYSYGQSTPYDPASFAPFSALLKQYGDSVAAVILEPVVQGAGGMWFYHPDYLRAVREACTRHGCLLIADEIATGFGRTGSLFACGHADITPDILCVGKGLTGGVMSLAATLTTAEVAHGISRDGGVLMHGPTYMGNPLACAVAQASLGLLAHGNWVHDVARIESGLHTGLHPCTGHSGVRDVRVLGAIGVLEMESPVNTDALQRFFIRNGVWLRPFGRLIYVMPPYVASDEDITTLTRAMCGAVMEGAWR